MFGKGTTQLMPCMTDALTTYATGQLKVLGTEPERGGAIQIYPNPAQNAIRIVSTGRPALSVDITDLSGRVVRRASLMGNEVSLSSLQTGQYVLTVYDKTGALLGAGRLMKY